MLLSYSASAVVGASAFQAIDLDSIPLSNHSIEFTKLKSQLFFLHGARYEQEGKQKKLGNFV